MPELQRQSRSHAGSVGSWLASSRPQRATLRRQPHLGNQSAQRQLQDHLFQAKLAMNQPGDEFEQEADRVSDQVMRMSDFGAGDPLCIQRMGAHCQNELETPRVQRLCSECEEQMHRQTNDRSRRTPQVSPKLQSQIAALRGGGQPLDASTRRFFEQRFGRDFGQVRIHERGSAAATAREVNALAYTMGRDIVFAPSQYSPGTQRGKRLLAHELTHTIQQGHARESAPAVQRMGDPAKVPAGLACPVATDSPSSSILEVLFPNAAAALTLGQKRSIQSFAVSWNAAGASTDVRVDGYASPAGTDELNWRLSCERAQAAASELSRPTAPGIPSVPSSRLNVLAQGETSEFSRIGGTDPDAPNRRAVISSPVPLPPIPPTPPPPAPAPSLCPAVPTTTPGTCPDRHTGYCDAHSCFPSNPWLDCVCTTSGQICDAVDAFHFSGTQGSLLEVCVEAEHRSHPVGIPFIKRDINDKGDWFQDVNRCIWGHWRTALDALHDPTRPIPGSATPEWSAAITTCRASGLGSSACCKAQVEAEQKAIDRCIPYDSSRFGTLPTDVPSTPGCSGIAARIAPGTPFTGDFGNVADRIAYGNTRCCP